jgi:hypothetical protein
MGDPSAGERRLNRLSPTSANAEFDDRPSLQPVSSISLFDGSPITEFDVLPASASRLL